MNDALTTDAPCAKSRKLVYHYLLEEHARQTPDKPCLMMGDRTLSWAETDREANRWGHGLALAGVRKGDRVLVMIPSGIEHVVIWLGLCKIGALIVPVNEAYKGNMLLHQVNDSGARFAIIDQTHLPHWHALGTTLKTLQTIAVHGTFEPHTENSQNTETGSDWTYLPVGDLRSADDSALPPVVEYYDPMGVFYTSGTTGPSKGVLYSYAQAHATALPPAQMCEPHDVFYMFLPMFHVGLSNMFGIVVIAGATMAIRQKFSVQAFWDDVRRYQITMTLIMSTMPNFIASQVPKPSDRDHTLKKLIMIPLMKNVEQFSDRFGCRIATYYNMTEISTPICSNGFELANSTSCGRLRAGVSARIVDQFDEPVPAGSVGELVVRSENPWEFNLGYWQNPQKTAESWRNQWLHTGDAFSVDAQGNYYFVDRIKDAIRRRGENVSSFEVENEVDAHPAVLESAAIAVPSEFSEDEIKVVVSLKPGASLTPAALLDFLRSRLPVYMLPRYIEIHLSELPKTPTGKIRKVALRELGIGQAWDKDKNLKN